MRLCHSLLWYIFDEFVKIVTIPVYSDRILKNYSIRDLKQKVTVAAFFKNVNDENRSDEYDISTGFEIVFYKSSKMDVYKVYIRVRFTFMWVHKNLW